MKKALNRSRALLLLISFLGFASLAQATTLVGGKHVYIVYPGLDTIWGSYIFVVDNDGQSPEKYTFPVMLPKETEDFQAQDTLSSEELKLGADGGITIEKVFPPGETLIQIGFKVPANQGKAVATFKAPYPYETLGVFVTQDSVTVEGPSDVTVQKGMNLSGRMFDTYTAGAGDVGKTVVYTLEGVPEGRGRLWIFGGVVAALLLITGLAVAFFTRPQLSQTEEVV